MTKWLLILALVVPPAACRSHATELGAPFSLPFGSSGGTTGNGQALLAAFTPDTTPEAGAFAAELEAITADLVHEAAEVEAPVVPVAPPTVIEVETPTEKGYGSGDFNNPIRGPRARALLADFPLKTPDDIGIIASFTKTDGERYLAFLTSTPPKELAAFYEQAYGDAGLEIAKRISIDDPESPLFHVEGRTQRVRAVLAASKIEQQTYAILEWDPDARR